MAGFYFGNHSLALPLCIYRASVKALECAQSFTRSVWRLASKLVQLLTATDVSVRLSPPAVHPAPLGTGQVGEHWAVLRSDSEVGAYPPIFLSLISGSNEKVVPAVLWSS